MNDPVFQKAFAEYDRNVRIANSKLGAILASILMPAGVVLDWFVYPDKLGVFFQIRILCSILVMGVWGLFHTHFGRRHFRVLGMTWYMLPALSIAWMIYAAGDPLSPYYAGLNIVLVGMGLILPWTYQENLLAGGLVIAMYIGAVALQGALHETRYLVNNVYFLILTALIVVIGSYFHSKLRFREFSLRYELDQNRKKLEEGNRKLVEMDRVKTRFFANMSHELRTPLTLLIAPLETLRLHGSRLAPEQVMELLGTMHVNGMRLLKLINDLLDLERLDSGNLQVKPEPLRVVDFVRGLASSVHAMAQEKGLKLTTEVDETIGAVKVDRDKLEKVLLNLLFNALKFTPAGGSVNLSVHRVDARLVLRVSDTGSGIAPEQLPFIFDRFWQADNSAHRKHQGTGIGLALVKELVEAHNGTVKAESQLGKGTTMTIELPYEEADTGQASGDAVTLSVAGGAPAMPSKDGEWLSQLYRRAELYPAMTPLQQTLRREEVEGGKRKPMVLVADDEPDMLRFLKSQLSAEFQVLEAVDGLQAVEKASQFLPEIVLLDMMMPEKDGFQVCRELRGKTSTQNIPIILLTARADEETKLSALAVGASDFLSKPFSTTELHLRVTNLVAQRKMQRELARNVQILEATMEELKEAQAQLVQSEKLAGLGRMSAGIIHEINNPLNYAKTGLYALRKKEQFLPEDEREDFLEVLRDIEDGVDRVKTIVSDLRTFTHPGGGEESELETVDLGKVVASGLRFVSDQLGGIAVENTVPENFIAMGNSNKLVQVAVNLLQNAIDALKEKPSNDEPPKISISGRTGNGKIILAFRDNGPGIKPEALNNIFDPFFTTKDVGKGMGLGLTICHRIVAECGGNIAVKSEPGRFTEFALEFPEKYNTLNSSNMGENQGI